jgi:hypothetical protein
MKAGPQRALVCRLAISSRRGLAPKELYWMAYTSKSIFVNLQTPGSSALLGQHPIIIMALFPELWWGRRPRHARGVGRTLLHVWELLKLGLLDPSSG